MSWQGSELPLPFCCLAWAACMLECSGLGIFTARIFPSQQQSPAGAWGQLLAGLSSHILWEMQARDRGNLGFWSFGAQERQWEALGTRDSTSVSRECGCGHIPRASLPPAIVSHEGEQPQMPSSGEAVPARPKFSLAHAGVPSHGGSGIAEFVTGICPPLCEPHNTSRAWSAFLVTFPALVPFAS